MKQQLFRLYLFLEISFKNMDDSMHELGSASHLRPRKNTLLHHEKQIWKSSSKIKTSPSATFGKSHRNSAEKERAGPGPGSYNIHSPLADKQVVSLKATRMVRVNTESPGPGSQFSFKRSYTAGNLFGTKKYSFPKSKNSLVNQVRPSPNSYHVSSSEKSQFVTFTRQKRLSLADQSKRFLPGPGKYEKGEKQLSKKEYSFTRSKKMELQSHQKQPNPGPGSYELSKNRHKLKSYKFSQALKGLATRQPTPGPGYYQGESSMMRHNGGIMDKQPKQFQCYTETPGPGTYKQVSVEHVKNREPTMKFSQAEGRGVKVVTESNARTYSHEHETSRKILGGVIGKDKGHLIAYETPTPSALNYTPNFDEVLSRSGNIVFGKEERIKKPESTLPGPGYYEAGKAGKATRHPNRSELRTRRATEQSRKNNKTALSYQ